MFRGGTPSFQATAAGHDDGPVRRPGAHLIRLRRDAPDCASIVFRVLPRRFPTVYNLSIWNLATSSTIWGYGQGLDLLSEDRPSLRLTTTD